MKLNSLYVIVTFFFPQKGSRHPQFGKHSCVKQCRLLSDFATIRLRQFADDVAAVVALRLVDEGADGDGVRGLVAVLLAPLLAPELAGAGEDVMPLEEVGVGRVKVGVCRLKALYPFFGRVGISSSAFASASLRALRRVSPCAKQLPTRAM